MTQRKATYDEATKSAVMAALLAGQSVSQVAKDYKIPRGTVQHWKGETESLFDSVEQEKKTEIGNLIMDYLGAMLRASKIQAEFFGDKTWLRDQEAGQLAILHGVGIDKAVRLLEAISSGGSEESESSPEPV